MPTYNYGVWLILVIAETGGDLAVRMRTWRALKGLGAAVVRDGVYLLPDRADLRAKLAEVRAELAAAGGRSLLFAAPGIDPDDAATLREFFDRSDDYAAIAAGARDLENELDGHTEGHARRALRALQRSAAQLDAIDYFRTSKRDDASTAIARAHAAFTARLANLRKPNARPER
jgi:hypothetical protein